MKANYFDLAKQLNIGNTPLVKFPSDDAEIFVKREDFNGGGSVKDRPALNMIVAAINAGLLQPGGTIVEATSGNMGIALATIGKALGYKVILTMPETMTVERRTMLAALGAELVLTEGALGMKGAIAKSKEIAATVEGAVEVRQFENVANVEAHYISTAEEIIKQLDGATPDAVVFGVGTGGTIMGVGKRLREVFPNIKVYAVEPAESAVLSGQPSGKHKIQGIGAGFLPQIVDPDIFTDVVRVPSEDALAAAKMLNLEYDIAVGFSSGAAIFAALQLAKTTLKGKTIVTLFPDSANRYPKY
jgi:cysteine synthase A